MPQYALQYEIVINSLPSIPVSRSSIPIHYKLSSTSSPGHPQDTVNGLTHRSTNVALEGAVARHAQVCVVHPTPAVVHLCLFIQLGTTRIYTPNTDICRSTSQMHCRLRSLGKGEAQKKLDIISNEVLLEANLWGGSLMAMASEEMEHPFPIPSEYPRGKYLLLFDPLDGSSNRITGGAPASARAIAIDWRCPPDRPSPRSASFRS